MNKKRKFYLGTNLAAACFLTLAACSSLKSTTGGNHGGTANLPTRTVQEEENPEDARVHPGQPYNMGTYDMGFWPDG